MWWLENAELKQWWERGEFEAYDDQTLVKLLIKWQTFVPEWTRVMRLMRDIPVTNILDGARFSNLRQILTSQPQKLKQLVGETFFRENKLDQNPWRPRDIRSREIGFADLSRLTPQQLEPTLVRRDYHASDGDEVFLSFESADYEYLFALLRLRRPSGDQSFVKFRSILNAKTALIREVHSYGGEIEVGGIPGLGQHRGLGQKLLAQAETLAKDEWGMKQIAVISGVGTREYYRKFGYELRSTYLVKKLDGRIQD